MLVCALSVHIAHETAGAARIRHPCALCILEGESYLQTSGATRRGKAKSCCAVIASEAKQSILSLRRDMDCFAALARRLREFRR